jgi:dienelactone hydrolase
MRGFFLALEGLTMAACFWPRGAVGALEAAATVCPPPREFAGNERDSNDNAELFLYSGKKHYFADSSLPSYDAGATALLTQRVLDFLETR